MDNLHGHRVARKLLGGKLNPTSFKLCDFFHDPTTLYYWSRHLSRSQYTFLRLIPSSLVAGTLPSLEVHSSAEVASDLLAASVHHVAPRSYIFPKCILMDVDNPGWTFFPWDFIFYRHSSQPSNQQTQQEQYKKTHELLRSICRDPVGFVSNINMDTSPYVAISDLYTKWIVRAYRRLYINSKWAMYGFYYY